MPSSATRSPFSSIAGLVCAVLLLSACGQGGREALSSRDARPVAATAIACADFAPQRRPFFGDTHVHTSRSLDARQFQTRSTPDDAYRYAQGEAIGMAPYDDQGRPTRSIQLDRPLDFAAVTDHSEWLAETQVCFDPSSLQYNDPYCQTIRGSEEDSLLVTIFTGIPLVSDFLNSIGLNASLIDSAAYVAATFGVAFPVGNRSSSCLYSPAQCEEIDRALWREAVDTAARHNQPCRFSTFAGYEYTGIPQLNNKHRNVLFRNDQVIPSPISYYDADQETELWNALDAGCQARDGCEVLTIPHNSNLGGGDMFEPGQSVYGNTYIAPYDAATSAQRRRMEPLVEIYQHKGSSECLNGNGTPFGSADELCEFEMIATEVCSGGPDDSPDCAPACSRSPVPYGGFSAFCVEPADYVRGALRRGLVEEANTGENPFKFGLIASTDTHNSTPGEVREYGWRGHVAANDDALSERIGRASAANNAAVEALGSLADFSNLSRYSAGGLAVLWAEQNTRDSLFDAMQRREAYGTSGPRIVARLFGGWDYPADLCERADFARQGYAGGSPMGGELPLAPPGAQAPRFAVSALMDPGSDNELGVPLQRIQIIKGWKDGEQTFETVYEVAGDPDNGASVDLQSCQPQGAGFAQLCSVWQDPQFDPEQAAFYYARVVENPRCRWHRAQCNQALAEQGLSCADVDAEHPLSGCCQSNLPDTIQERAWTSPIWYSPTG